MAKKLSFRGSQTHAAAGLRQSSRYTRRLLFEQLETRKLLTAVTDLNLINITGNVGEKPESKLWEHDNKWWGVMSNSSGTHVWRLDGTNWTPVFELPNSSPNLAKADIKVLGDVTHVLLEDDSDTKLASLQYVPGSATYELWDARPALADVELAFSVEAATIDIDSTGRMWVAYDNNANRVQVRYSDSPYDDWTAAPITLASDIDADDIAVVTALPNQTVGVMWSDQNADRFGFRVHVDGANPQAWSTNEVPASQSALNVGRGMADDHINLAVAPDSTLYAAVKTSYDTPGYPKLALLVRRPSGVWDDLHSIGDDGTRPALQLNVATNQLIYTYEDDDFYFRECSVPTLVCSSAQALITNGKNASSTKQNVTDDLVIVTSGKGTSGKMWGALLTFDVLNNVAPSVDAGPDRTIFDVDAAVLDGAVTDDGLPDPPSDVTTTWSVASGPGSVTFADPFAVDTTATFGSTGTYVLRLTANDSELTSTDLVSVTVNPTPANQAPSVNAGPDQTLFISPPAVLDGTASDDGLPIPPGALTTQWSVMSGPGAVTFGDPNAVDTTASFSAAGNYVLRLTANDGEILVTDDVTLTVNELPPNVAPQVDAGPDKAIALSSSANLSGVVTDDGQPNPPATVTAMWSQFSGPGTALFVDASDPNTSVTFDQVGSYVLRLTGDDSLLTTSDDLTITVIEDPPTQTISFQDGAAGYAGTRDIKIRSDKPDRNFGSTVRLELDGKPDFSTALKWDVFGIPAGANVVSASITVNAIKDSFDTFQIYEMVRPWDENTATFVESQAGVAWDVPGAQGLGDRGTTVLGDITAPSLGQVTAELNAAGRALVQQWIVNPTGNYGIILQNYNDSSTDDLDFSSREASAVADRPKLNIVYAVPPATSLSIDDVAVDESAGTATFTVTLSAPTGSPVNFAYTTADVSAAAGSDYSATSGNKTILSGATSTTITVPISEDNLDESDETFQVNLSNASNATILDGTGVGTITDNDVSLLIDDVTVDEGAATATFTVSVSELSGLPVDFTFDTSDVSAFAGSDYAANSGNRTIPAGTPSTTITVDILDDLLPESDETFQVNLSNASNATILDGIGVGTISDNEVTISIDDVVVDEDDTTATFTVSLSNIASLPVDFVFQTSDITATAGSDYTAASGGGTILAGQASTTITIDIAEDTLDESDETFWVSLSNPVNALLLDDKGLGTITDDDPVPSLSIDDVTVDEGAGLVTLTATLSAFSGLPVGFTFITSDLTATSGSDYTATSGSETILAGVLSTTFTVDITEDTVGEDDETFEVILSNPTNATLLDGTALATITDNDFSLLIDDVTVDENAATATFTVSLSAVNSLPVDFAFATSDVSAIAGSDYTESNGNRTIVAGETSTTIAVDITDDALGESDETFEVILFNATNATILDGVGVGTINDNDLGLSISGVTVNESAATASFTVNLSAVSSLPVDFQFATSDVTATAGSDYESISGTRTILAGATSTTITVDISEDTLDENDETFQVVLSNPVNAAIVDGVGIGTITDNDPAPSLSIDDVTVDEGGGTATFTVNLDAVSGLPIEFEFATSNVTAAAGSDYAATSGNRTILAGSTSATILVSITEDTEPELGETFEVILSNPLNATILDGTGTGEILDNDAASVTVSFQDNVLPGPTYTGTRDMKIRGDFPDRVLGSSRKLEIDGKPDISSFIKWDISSIPAGSSVLSASITINVINTSVDEFSLYQALQPWVESEATFNEFSVGSPWQVAGAQGPNDRGAVILGTVTAPSLGAVTIDLTSAGVAVVQDWLDGTVANNGFVFQNYEDASTDDLDFASRDGRDDLAHPIFTIEYVTISSGIASASSNSVAFADLGIGGGVGNFVSPNSGNLAIVPDRSGQAEATENEPNNDDYYRVKLASSDTVVSRDDVIEYWDQASWLEQQELYDLDDVTQLRPDSFSETSGP